MILGGQDTDLFRKEAELFRIQPGQDLNSHLDLMHQQWTYGAQTPTTRIPANRKFINGRKAQYIQVCTWLT